MSSIPLFEVLVVYKKCLAISRSGIKEVETSVPQFQQFTNLSVHPEPVEGFDRMYFDRLNTNGI
jgi:hypothetical protein